MLEQSGLYYPNRFARCFLQAIAAVMDPSPVDELLNLAGLDRWPADNLEREFDFANFAMLSLALEEIYGTRGGRGVALRVGRSWFMLGMRSFDMLAGLSHPRFQALPLDQRALLGLSALSTTLAKVSDQCSEVKQDENAYYVHVADSPMAWKRSADKPVCHALAGLFQGCLNWATGGYEYHVQEVTCRAVSGSECVFKISKKPIGQL